VNETERTIMSDPYDIGYGKPPRHSRFPKGRSGNPKGRPKGSLSIKHKLRKLADETVTVRWQGEARTVSIFTAIFYAAASTALKGNASLQMKLLDFMPGLDEADDAGRTPGQGGGVLVVPGMMDIDDWEKAAEKQQAPHRGAVDDPLVDGIGQEPADPGKPR
jgi:hypothetical protein